MTNKPIAGRSPVVSKEAGVNIAKSPIIQNIPMGMETPTNCPLWRAGPVLGTKFPRMMPTAMTRRIHIARKRSRMPRLLKLDAWGFPTLSVNSG